MLNVGSKKSEPQATCAAFAALTHHGLVVTWGDEDRGGDSFSANEQRFLLFFVDWRYERYEQNIDIAEFDGVSLSLIWKICLIEKS